MRFLVSPLVPGVVNNAYSFLVAWDGSKEGWEDSDLGDMLRERFIGWMREQKLDDGSSPLHWVEVQYGGGDREAVVLSHAHDGVVM
jgi:hypothetical protein